MPSLSMSMPHALGQEQAMERLKSFLDLVKERYQDKVSDLNQSWQDNKLTFGFSTFGFKISGDVNVGPSDVKLNASIPIAAMMFKGKIEEALRGEMAKVLA